MLTANAGGVPFPDWMYVLPLPSEPAAPTAACHDADPTTSQEVPTFWYNLAGDVEATKA